MKNEPMKIESAVKTYSMAEKWAIIVEAVNADAEAHPADYPSDEEYEAMAKLRGCTVMELRLEDAKRDIAFGRGYPMPLDGD
jgi:hypothetical protein